MTDLVLKFSGLLALVLLVGSWLVGSEQKQIVFSAANDERTTISNPWTFEQAVRYANDIIVDTSDLFVDVSTDQIAVGTTTTSGSDVAIVDQPAGTGAAASTTVKIGNSATTTSRGQFEIQQVDGGVSCAYVNAAGTAWIVADGVCVQ